MLMELEGEIEETAAIEAALTLVGRTPSRVIELVAALRSGGYLEYLDE